MEKGLKELSNLKTSHTFLFYKKKKKCSEVADLFCDEKWLSVLCYPAHNFGKINTPNLSLQGESDILTMSEKEVLFKRILYCCGDFVVFLLKIIWVTYKNSYTIYVKNLETKFSNTF